MSEATVLEMGYSNSRKVAIDCKEYVKDLALEHPQGICYLSHPYGGLKDNVTRCGIFANEVQKVLGQSATIVSPIHNFSWLSYREETNKQGYWEDMVHCIRLLSMSDFMVLGEGWEESLGCCVEYVYAVNHQIPVYTFPLK